MHAVEHFREVDEADCKKYLEFSTLLNNSLQREDLFCARVFWPEACLFFTQLRVYNVTYSIEDDPAVDFSRD